MADPEIPAVQSFKLTRSTSDATLGIVQPPYGLDLVATDDSESSRSRVHVNPKYPVPLRPKMKHIDHWDLLVAYDAAKHREETAHFITKGHFDEQARFRSVLDGQMEEVRALREQQHEQRRRDREDMLAKMEENRHLDAEEQARERAKTERMIQSNVEMGHEIEKRRQDKEAKKQQEGDMMAAWLRDEKSRREEEGRIQAERHKEKCKAARAEMLAALEERERQRQAQMKEDREVIAESNRRADDRLAQNQASVQARMDVIEKNSATLGAEIAARDAQQQRELEERVRKAQEDADRKAREEAQRKKKGHDKAVKDILASLDEQMRQKGRGDLEEKEADRLQGIKFRQLNEEAEREEKDKSAKARQKRAELDHVLIDQIRQSVANPKRAFVVTVEEQRRELAYNRALLKQMSADGYEEGFTNHLLDRATDRGKLKAFPSVGSYEGPPPHALELQAPCL